VIIAFAVTRDGMPVHSWVLPGDTADVAAVARIKDDLRAWHLGRCVFVGDAGAYSAENLAVALARSRPQVQRAAELRFLLPWPRIALELGALKAVRYRVGERTIVQRTKIADGLGEILKKLGISIPKQVLSISEPATGPAAT
jgi:hypothetical protein